MGQRPKTGGRTLGTPNRRTVASRRDIQATADPLAFLASVMKGDVIDGQMPTMSERLGAARELRRVLVPDARERPVTLALPVIEGPGDLLTAMRTVIAAVAAGELTPGEGRAVADLLGDACKAFEFVELADRISRLERSLPCR